jgi:hypothetical protein
LILRARAWAENLGIAGILAFELSALARGHELTGFCSIIVPAVTLKGRYE